MILYRKYLNQHISQLRVPDLKEYAKQWNIDIENIQGTGKGGMIKKKDIAKSCRNFQLKYSSINSTPVAELERLLKEGNVDITTIEGSGRKGKVMKSDLLKAMHEFLGDYSTPKQLRNCIKIPNCSYNYWLDSDFDMTNIDVLTYKIDFDNRTYQNVGLAAAYDPESNNWTMTNDRYTNSRMCQLDGRLTKHLIQYRKALLFLEAFTIYLKIKSVLTENEILEDIIFYTIFTYCQKAGITDIKIM